MTARKRNEGEGGVRTKKRHQYQEETGKGKKVGVERKGVEPGKTLKQDE